MLTQTKNLINIGYSSNVSPIKAHIEEIKYGIEEEGGYYYEYTFEECENILFTNSSVTIIISMERCNLFVKELGSTNPLIAYSVANNTQSLKAIRTIGQNAVRYQKNLYLLLT